MGKRLTVLRFSTANLAHALENKYVDAEATQLKKHFRYFREYLGKRRDGLRAETIVIEHQYLSKSYLSDYASYYASCFESYDRLCKRVHFFAYDFAEADFLDAVTNPASTHNGLWDRYLGYIIIKPLPDRQIGPTLLQCYTGSNQRHYPVTREFKVNVFGRNTSLSTLIFQEQDKLVSACATTALWMAFHKTAFLFQTPLPTPNQITVSAKNLFKESGRTFPSDGLDHYQIGNAFQSVGLEFELRTPNRDLDTHRAADWRGFIYAYLRIGLPVLLFIGIDQEDDRGPGGHLVVVTGYRENPKRFRRSRAISLAAEQIERFYVHDDQVGPFSRLGFAKDADGSLETAWWPEHDLEHKFLASLDSIFVPLVSEIRITYEEIFAAVRPLDLYLTLVAEGPAQDLVWDIYLEFSNIYKNEVRDSADIPVAFKAEVLTRNLPRYIWVARGRIGEALELDLVFDATDLNTGFHCRLLSIYNTSLRGIIRQDLDDPQRLEQIRDVSEMHPSFLKLLKAAAQV